MIITLCILIKNFKHSHAMKIFFTISMGIVILITILNAEGCKSARNNSTTKGHEKIKITIKSAEINGEKHLKMSDPKNTNVIDNLITDVKPGDIVFWKLKIFSGIKSIDTIYATTGEHIIFKKNPSLNSQGKFELVVPDDAKPTQQEKYAIDYILRDGTPGSIDPYIRIEE